MFLLEEIVAQLSSAFNPYACSRDLQSLARDADHPPPPASNADSWDELYDYYASAAGGGGGIYSAGFAYGGGVFSAGGGGRGGPNSLMGGRSVDEDYHIVGSGSESGFPSPTCERKPLRDGSLVRDLSQVVEGDGGELSDGAGAGAGTWQGREGGGTREAGVGNAGGAIEAGGGGGVGRGVVYPGNLDCGNGFGNRRAASPIPGAGSRTWSGAGVGGGEKGGGLWNIPGPGGYRVTSLRGDGSMGKRVRRMGSKVGGGERGDILVHGRSLETMLRHPHP